MGDKVCKYSMFKTNEVTHKGMIYCNNELCKKDVHDVCVCQRFRPDKGYYVPHNQNKRHCKFFEV